MLAERGASAWARPLQQQRCVAAPLRRPYRRGRCAAAPPPSAAAADEPAAPSASGRPDSARGLTVDRQLATLQGLIQSQAEAVAALTVRAPAAG
ncbi:hypothetical protein Rsub_00858 [Raphidocelis subcapitata]|uniref:Uncharacterized protein n=1 Tax=Raphidocelis subcapitata TaxID=307507 RepID=A0A2V0NL76_9CHLO|nr:hypothetical protein Rsub_00858 [Raphidocelis subcapitata]|eukprot:GBF88146.1 hypothetical protein Rsub_00858 [Raphidocelis subcapitata]